MGRYAPQTPLAELADGNFIYFDVLRFFVLAVHGLGTGKSTFQRYTRKRAVEFQRVIEDRWQGEILLFVCSGFFVV